MTDNVHTLPGVAVRAERGVPDPEIIAAVEQLLDEARTGVLRGLTFAALSTDGMIRTDWRGAGTSSNEVHGAIVLLEARYARARLEDMDGPA